MSMFDSGIGGATVGTGAGRGTQTAVPGYSNPAPEVQAGLMPIFNMLAGMLSDYGLGSLFTLNNGQPGGWLWNQIQQGFDTSDELMLALEQTDAFRERFGVIVEQQQRAAAGQPGQVMTPAEVLEYENTVRSLMRAGGMPEWFYDQPEDFNELILNNMSVAEVQERIVQAYEYVDNAPAEVRQAFTEFYGVGNSDAALAAYVLDPNRTTAQLNRATKTAYTAGMAERYDIQLTRAQAQLIAELPNTEEGIVAGLEQISSQSELFEEGLFERGDLTAETTGVAATFQGDAAARTALQRRIAERTMGNRANTGGAIVTNQGLAGAASAGGG